MRYRSGLTDWDCSLHMIEAPHIAPHMSAGLLASVEHFFKCLLRISITKNQGRIHPAMDRLNRLAESFVREEKANRECRIMTNHVVFFWIVGFLIRSTEIR